VGHAADSVYIAQLESNHSELLMTAAAALEGSGDTRAAVLLLSALDRVSALRQETSRGARVALLERAGELGGDPHHARVRSYLRDFDHAVAQRAASVLEEWTGTRPDIAPEPLPRQPLPSFDDAAQLARSTFVLELEDDSEVIVRLLPFTAPTNAF